MDTVITGGTIVTADASFRGTVGIRDDTIAFLGTPDDDAISFLGTPDGVTDADEYVDATGKLIFPGVVDPHVHIDYIAGDRVGTYRTETAAAALGGVTTVLDFAWSGGPIRSEGTLIEGIEYKRARGSDALVDFGLHAVVNEQTSLDELDDAVDTGVTSFKLFMAPKRVAVSNGFMETVFERVAALDAVAMVHNEDPSVCATRTDRLKQQGRGEPTAYPSSRPRYVETVSAETSVRLAVEAGAKYYGVHTTCRDAAAVIQRYQEQGYPVRGETCTHYTTLDASVHEELGSLPQLAPPLRTPEDRDSMFEALQRGTLDVVATDHVVYEQSRKQAANWWDVPLGANSVQRSLPAFYDEAVSRRGLSPSFVVRVMCTNPARLFGLPAKGTLQPGTDADIVIFDPEKTATVSADENASNSDYSIYEGRTLRGCVETVFLRGTPIVEEGVIVAEPGTGQYLTRQRPDWDADTLTTPPYGENV